jgi:hypothetical protein
LFFSYAAKPLHLNQRLVAIRTNPKDAPIVTALLNSAISLLIVELNGVSRNLGSLDLNADFFKTKMRMLNPALLNEKQKQTILDKFKPLIKRSVEQYETEFSRTDRVAFDKAVLKAFGFKAELTTKLYKMLTETIRNRTEMKNR